MVEGTEWAKSLTIEQKKTPEMFERAKSNLEYAIAREKHAIKYSATGIVRGYEWHRPFHEQELRALEAQYALLMKQGYV